MIEVSIEESIFEKLQAHAIPLQDTVSSVIARIIDYYEKKPSGSEEAADEETADLVTQPENDHIIKCDPSSPISLRHTVPDKIVLDGKEFAYNRLYWNTLLIEVIKQAAVKTSPDAAFDMILVNHVKGAKSENNFVFIKEANLSIQLQNSDAAWKATYNIALKTKLTIEVDFHWNKKDNAIHPGKRGSLAV